MQSTNTYAEFQAHSYPRIASELSGHLQDPEAWQKGQTQHQTLLDQSYHLADLLEGEGITAYQDQDLTLFGLHSKSYRKLPNFRNIQFLPSVAQKNRRSVIKAAEFFLKKNQLARNWTFTSGVRCSPVELPNRHRWMARKLSRLNTQPFMQELGARFVFRATEFGELAPDCDGNLSLHPHMHAIMTLDRMLSRKQFVYLLKRVTAFWGFYCKDCGKLRDVREMIKYCVKPSDLEHLNGKQVAELYHCSKGLRLVESMGGLREMKRQIKENNQKIIRRNGQPKLVPNWHGGHPVDKVELHLQGRCVDDPSTPQLVAWCAPARVFTPVTEPLFLVHGLGNTDPARVFGWNDVKIMEHSISVHTKMLTDLDQIRKSSMKREKIYEDQRKVPNAISDPF
jgi:hypothetical protein